jgi:fatty-acid desaturase
MNPVIAYILVGVMTVLVIYFAYQSYRAYQKNPSRWFHLLFGEKVGEGILRTLG